MIKLWYVIRYEYLRHVLRKGFQLALISVPAWILVMGLVIFLLVRLETDNKPVGYVDHSGLLADAIPLPEPEFPDRPVPILAFTDEDSAHEELESGGLQAYFVLPEDYPQNDQVKHVFIKPPSSSSTDQFRDFIKLNLLADEPAEISRRLLEGADISVVAADNSDVAQGAGVIFKFIGPFFSGFALMIAIFTSSGYLMQAVVDEKQNRTMEIMVTSIAPTAMMAGKVIALISVGLTQILAWFGFALIGFLVGRGSFDFIDNLNFSLGNIGLILLMIIPAFVMISAIMAAIGATVTEASEGQQMTGLITLPVMLPFMLFGAILSNPNSPLVIGMSFFPLTAPLTMIIRSGFTTIPTWQIAVSTTILVLSSAGSLWLAGRLFRMGMLRYGQKLTLKEIVSVIPGVRRSRGTTS